MPIFIFIFNHLIDKIIYQKYPVLNSIKLKIICNSLQTANKMLSDNDLNSLCKLNVPFDQCEVKGVAPITSDYSEKNFLKI